MAKIRISRPRFTRLGATGIAGAQQLQGKELSYNNLVDLDAAWQLISEFDTAASAIIKHTNPCGCAEAATLAESYRRAFEADPVSAFGGVLAFNREVDRRNSGGNREDVSSKRSPRRGTPKTRCEFSGAKKNLRLLRVGSRRAARA